ncbi:MAG: PilZ domain-containing protein [Myxococcales bacterium]|nr:PilZ domain-containing protein [Myxococcales bacterium]
MAVPSQISERRRAFRLPTTGTVFLWRANARGDRYELRDLSQSGCRAIGRGSPGSGPLSLVLHSYTGQRLAIPSRIVRTRSLRPGQWELGIRFLKVTQATEDQMHDLVLAALERRAPPAQRGPDGPMHSFANATGFVPPMLYDCRLPVAAPSQRLEIEAAWELDRQSDHRDHLLSDATFGPWSFEVEPM